MLQYLNILDKDILRNLRHRNTAWGTVRLVSSEQQEDEKITQERWVCNISKLGKVEFWCRLRLRMHFVVPNLIFITTLQNLLVTKFIKKSMIEYWMMENGEPREIHLLRRVQHKNIPQVNKSVCLYTGVSYHDVDNPIKVNLLVPRISGLKYLPRAWFWV